LIMRLQVNQMTLRSPHFSNTYYYRSSLTIITTTHKKGMNHAMECSFSSGREVKTSDESYITSVPKEVTFLLSLGSRFWSFLSRRLFQETTLSFPFVKHW
jgi:hypothetical protein